MRLTKKEAELLKFVLEQHRITLEIDADQMKEVLGEDSDGGDAIAKHDAECAALAVKVRAALQALKKAC